MAAMPSQMPLQGLFSDYKAGPFYDEMFSAPDEPRAPYAKIYQKLARMVASQFEERRQHADFAFLLQGITFTVYSDGRGTERLFPFDLIPRIIPNSEWQRIDPRRPMHDETQSCLSFRLITKPASRGTSYRDAFGNWVHQFNILPEHQSLKIEAESVVLAHDAPAPPADCMRLSELDSHREEWEEEYLDFIAQSGYVPHVAKLDELIAT